MLVYINICKKREWSWFTHKLCSWPHVLIVSHCWCWPVSSNINYVNRCLYAKLYGIYIQFSCTHIHLYTHTVVVNCWVVHSNSWFPCQYLNNITCFHVFYISELIILGFISLLLSFTTNYIAKICIPEKVADTMLPCKLRHNDARNGYGQEDKHKERDLWDESFSGVKRRFLAEASGDSCPYVRPFIQSITTSTLYFVSKGLRFLTSNETKNMGIF